MTIRLALVMSVILVARYGLLGPQIVKAEEPAEKSAVSISKNSVLQRWVGVWDMAGTLKPSKWHPNGGETTGKESTVWALKNRIIVTRVMSQPGGQKTFFISTYDSQRDAYPYWCFDSNGLLGAQWLLKWNASARTVVGRSTDSPPAWTSGCQDRFPDTNTILTRYWMRDENGKLLMETDARRDRLPGEREAAIVAAWKKHEPADDLPAELKVLDRMIGTWDTVSIQKPAEWTPAGGRFTAKIKREWILNGRVVMDTSIHSNGQESIALFGFSPGSKAYRSWWFNSEGHRNEGKGSWNEKSQTLSYLTELDDGKRMRTVVGVSEADKEQWQFKVTDADGKVYLDMETTATRRHDE